jgi:hypothetical protein
MECGEYTSVPRRDVLPANATPRIPSLTKPLRFNNVGADEGLPLRQPATAVR